MGGENPYIKQAEARLPSAPYTIRFRTTGGETKEVRVDPADLPEGHDGRQGSLLRTALAAGIPMDHACGGVCACSTCHVIVRKGFDTLNPSSEEEEDMLDLAPGLTDVSRLACQAIPDGSEDLEVEIPSWNRNIVSEGPH